MEAERLLGEGVVVVDKIKSLSMDRLSITMSRPAGDLGALGPYDTAKVAALTEQMDERGKKAMGIWAQVHATLATATSSVEDDVLDRERS